MPSSDGHSLTFSGSGYLKYHLMENDNKELMKLSLRVRTLSSHATVMYAKGTDYSILEVCVGEKKNSSDRMSFAAACAVVMSPQLNKA